MIQSIMALIILALLLPRPVMAVPVITSDIIARRPVVDARAFMPPGGCDGVSNRLTGLQAAQDYAASLGGGDVLVTGTCRTSGPLYLDSNVQLIAEPWPKTVIKPLDSATFTASQGVVMSRGFVTDANLWDYYIPYPAGLVMHVGLKNVIIDGNRANVANANGLMIYGGKWRMENVAVVNTAGHGIWTEAGVPVSSVSGDDWHDFLNMHESTGDGIFLANNNRHGWYYRGPNDTYIDNVQIKASGWSAFYQDSAAGIMSAGLKVGSMHAYVSHQVPETAPSPYMLEFKSSVFFDQLYVDTPNRSGVRFGSWAQGDRVYVMNRNRAAEGGYGVKADGKISLSQIIVDHSNAIASGDGGTDIHIASTATGSMVSQVRMTDVNTSASTMTTTAMLIEARSTHIGRTHIDGYASTGSVALKIDASAVGGINASDVTVDGSIRNCATGFTFMNAASNRSRIRLSIAYFTGQTAFTYTHGFTMLDNVSVSTYNLSNAAMDKLDSTTLTSITNSASGTYTPDGAYAHYVYALTGNVTINAPLGPTHGKRMMFEFQQDGTGGRTVTLDSAYKTSFTNTGNTAFKRHTAVFVYNSLSGLWIQESATSGWF